MFEFLRPILAAIVGAPVPKPVVVVPIPVSVLPVTRVETAGPTIAFVNQSTVVSDAQLAQIVAALQIQIDRDFAPIWKLGANLVAIPKGQLPAATDWIMYIMDTSDQAGALGYHDLTPAGYPIGKVFAKDDQKYGSSLSVTISHELVEILVDPYISNCVFSQQTNTTGTLYAFESADPVEDDTFGYLINGILVSDFVFPAWFEEARAPNSTQFDFRNIVHAPFTLAEGGYIGLFQVGPRNTGWTQKTADGVPSKRTLAKGEYSRFKRRANKVSPIIS
jgi:hypothetical protein